MVTAILPNKFRANCKLAFLLVAPIVLAACAATTPKKRTQAKIEIQEEVGFVITEEARVSNNIQLDYDEALTLLKQGRNGEGISMLELVADAAPELTAPHVDLGVAYHLTGDLKAAEEQLLLALELNPSHPIVHNELGIVYRKTGRFQQARQSYEAALAVYPGYHYARRNLAVLCDLYLVDLNCALENYEAYMTTVPGDDEAAMWISDIRARLGQ